MLSLRSAMPITTSSLSTCSGSGPLGSTRITSFAVVTARLSGIPGSSPSSHLMRSTLDGSDIPGRLGRRGRRLTCRVLEKSRRAPVDEFHQYFITS